MDAVSTMTKPCSQPDCGNEVEVEIPDDLNGTWRGVLERLPAMCDTCIELDERDEKRREEEQRRADYLQRLAASKMPRELMGVRFGQIDTTESETRAAAVTDAIRWGTGEIRGLVLSGPVGVGKSWMAAAAANARLWDRHVDWISVPALMVAVRAGFGTKEREEVTKLLMSQTALVLDDLDKVKPSDLALDVLFQAIDQRVQNGSPLIVTTNLKGDEVAELLGEPIRSRLSGYCRAHWIEGRDRRRKP